MFKNYLKVAFRNLGLNKGYSIINISGLAIGMASAILILLWVRNELRMDNFYTNRDRLYQSWNRGKGNDGLHCWNNTPKILGPTLKEQFPEIEKTTRVNWDANILFIYREKKMNVIGTMVDPDFLTMFDFPFLRGSKETALNSPNHIVITRSLAEALFGREEPMGKTLLLDNKYNFTVAGVMKDLPNETAFDFQFLLPWSYMHTIHQDDSTWDRNSTHNYALLKPNVSIESVNKKIRDIIIRHNTEGTTTESFLYPVSRLHLHGNFVNGVESGGRIQTVRILVIIAIAILLIACINFMNISTARSEKRAKEVGIRKVAGALKTSLIAQFIGESILISTIAGLFAVLMVYLALPAFNQLVGKKLFIDYRQVAFWLSLAGFVLLTGVIAGSYPAFFLSSFKPVSVLKGSFKKSFALITPRKILVVFQFSFAMILIVSTIIMRQQIKYAQARETGYDKNNLVYVPLSGDIEKNYNQIKDELVRRGIATDITKTSAPLTERWSTGSATWNGRDPNDRTSFDYFNADGNLVKTGGFQLVEGRDIDPKIYLTDTSAVLINESALHVMGFKQPIGQIINRGDSTGIGWHIVGVVKNFILQSPYENIGPLIIQGPRANWYNEIHIKLNPARATSENISAMEKLFNQYNPMYPFEFHFIDQQYAKKFDDEKIGGTLSALFAGLTIFISCFGLFGLAAYVAESRIREIGVRKVLGASVSSITTLLSKDFITLVIIAILLAAPVSWLIMNKWLAGFPYRITISAWVFLAAGAIAVLISLLTVSYQSIKAAVANPVKSLRAQ